MESGRDLTVAQAKRRIAMEDKIKRIIAEELGCQQDEVLFRRSLANDLGMDGFDRIEIVMALEEEFVINIPEEESDKWETVGNTIEYIKKAVQG